MTAATTAAPTGSEKVGFKLSNVGLTAFTLSHTYATTEIDEIDDAVEFGYVPAGVTVIGVAIKSADLDSNGTPTLTQSLTLGATEIVTDDDSGQAGTSNVYFIAPIELTAPTLVTMTATAAAATAVAGAQHLHFLYHSTSN